MPWAVFANKTQWQTFHDAICADLGFPRPGRRQSDGKVMLGNQWTTAAYKPRVGTVVINSTPRKVGFLRVPQAVVTRYGLNVITEPTNNGDETWTVTYQGNQYVVTPVQDDVAYPADKQTTSTWTDPADGTVYT